MNDTRTSASVQLELLEPLFNAATHEASAAMCRWTKGRITLSLDEVRELPLEEVCEELNIADQLLTMVVLSLDGTLGGEMILVFDEPNARELAASLLRQPVGPSEEWSELERSALTETGNILGCAYVNALTRLMNRELMPSPPYFVQDYGASVLSQALAVQAESCEGLLLGRTQFCREGQVLDWSVIFVPSLAMREALENAARTVVGST